MTDSKLHFIYDSENGSVRVVLKFSDNFKELEYFVNIGFFLVGSEDFMTDPEVDFLTMEDMKAIIKKMEEYNG